MYNVHVEPLLKQPNCACGQFATYWVRLWWWWWGITNYWRRYCLGNCRAEGCEDSSTHIAMDVWAAKTWAKAVVIFLMIAIRDIPRYRSCIFVTLSKGGLRGGGGFKFKFKQIQIS